MSKTLLIWPWLCALLASALLAGFTLCAQHNNDATPMRLRVTSEKPPQSLLLEPTTRSEIRRQSKLDNREEFFLRGTQPRGKTLHILGERHSGTSWLYEHLDECFNQSITVTETLTRWKHWFQYEEDIDAFNDLYVLTMFRNPFHWVEMMRQIPDHSPMHQNKNSTAFLTTPWTMPRYGHDLALSEEETKKAYRFCDQGFYYNEVVPCLPGDDRQHGTAKPKYELKNDLSGAAYESIVDLRRDKIINFLSIKYFQGVKHFEALKFEDLVSGGSNKLLQQLEHALGVKATCKPLEPLKLESPKVNMELIEWMQDHVDWNHSEVLIGYNKLDY